ncbi:hypothetical protein, partial [Rhizobium rhizogenes]|uniref:hypothetical protein n=1 Tax=Rhizobium rhizogenes TaxID=359 RepID=UPI001AEBCCF3
KPFPSKTTIAGAKTSSSLAMVARRPEDQNLKGEARSSNARSDSPLDCPKQRTGQSLPTKPTFQKKDKSPIPTKPHQGAFCVLIPKRGD